MTDTIHHLTYDDFGHITANDRGGTAADMTYSYDHLGNMHRICFFFVCKMKTIIIFFIFSLTTYLHAQKIDSIHIVSCLEDFESVKRLSRSDFLCSMHKNPEILDTTIYNQTEIDYFLTLIQDLEFIKDLNVSTDGFEWDTVLVDTKQGIIKIPIEQNSLDNRMYLELYSNHDKEIIWISVNMIDIGFKRYRLKKELVRFLGRFTNLFVEYWP